MSELTVFSIVLVIVVFIVFFIKRNPSKSIVSEQMDRERKALRLFNEQRQREYDELCRSNPNA